MKKLEKRKKPLVSSVENITKQKEKNDLLVGDVNTQILKSFKGCGKHDGIYLLDCKDCNRLLSKKLEKYNVGNSVYIFKDK